MKAIQYLKSVPRYLAVKGFYRRAPAIATSSAGMVRYADIPEPRLPNERWLRIRTRLSGICGSDMATITAKGSAYFSPFISCPFVFGHEVVGEVESVGGEVEHVRVGDRVVLEPALHCDVRGISPVCASCERGDYAACMNITRGDLSAGIQTGYCRDTGGGWSPLFLAHRRQVISVPDDLSDTAAVLVEPLACSVHAASRAEIPPDATILILGCGTIGLLTIAALRGLGFSNRILASAKYPRQRELALTLGANEMLPTGRGLYRELPQAVGAETYQPELGKPVLIGGVDVTFDCVGSSGTIDDAIRLTRAGGSVVLVGMPGVPKGVDWTNIWHKELTLKGAYAYGYETVNGERVRTFALAMDIARKQQAMLERLVDARYPLHRYRHAIQNALHAGERGSVKTVFEF